MGKAQRTKGATAERSLARLLREELGASVTRNLEQSRSGGHDLAGLPVALEVKRHAKATPASLRLWWAQALHQAARVNLPAALAYREDRQPWRFVLPLSVVRPDCFGEWAEIEPVQMEMTAFCAVMRELLSSVGPSGAPPCGAADPRNLARHGACIGDATS